MSQDDIKKHTKEIQDLTDHYIKELDTAYAHKEQEILQV